MFDIVGLFMKQNAQDGKWNKSVATSTTFSLLDSFDMNSLWFKSHLYVQVFDILMPIVYLFYEEKWEISFLNQFHYQIGTSYSYLKNQLSKSWG